MTLENTKIEAQLSVNDSIKKQYTPPDLKNFGQIADLVASGSTSKKENHGHSNGKL